MAKLTEEEKKENKRNLVIVLIILAIIAVIVPVIICTKNAKKISHPKESGLVYTTDSVYFYATGAAKDIVLNELLYPKNAEFEEEKDFTVVYDKGKGIYTVSGDVYAANGFNAKKKMFFRVELTLSDLNKDKYSYRKVSCSIT